MQAKLRQKAFGLMKSIETMSQKERSDLPSKSFGENYNRLREAVLKHDPMLEDLLPPPVEFDDYGFENYVDIKTKHRYSEIHAFCSELYHLLE